MTTTLLALIDETLDELHGHTADLEAMTFLTQDISSTDLRLVVDDASSISTGLIEIDTELLWVTRVDQTQGIVTIAPFGRGFRSSVAASHTANTAVTDNPRYPRYLVQQKINQAIDEYYPELFVVKTDESNTSSPVQVGYPVPADCDTIISLHWRTIGPSQKWETITRWKFNPHADTTVFPTGRSVDIADGMSPGQTIQVTYIARPGQFVNLTDTLDDIGLDDNLRDVTVYGACYRLVGGLEISRLQTSTISQSDRDQYVSSGAATAGAKYYLALFQDRLDNERQRMLQLTPINSHMTR